MGEQRWRAGVCAGMAIGCVALSGTAGVAGAAVVASYDFDGSSRASDDVDVNSTATSLANGPGLGAGVAVIAGSGNPAPALNIPGDQNGNTGGTPSESLATSGNFYSTFTVTPAAGTALDFTSLTFSAASFSGPNTGLFFLRSSADGFAATLGTTGNASFPNDPTYTPVTFVLSDDPTVQNRSTATEFRLYMLDNRGVNTAGTRIDNVVLNATVVPEPAAAAGVAAAGLGLLARRRRRA